MSSQRLTPYSSPVTPTQNVRTKHVCYGPVIRSVKGFLVIRRVLPPRGRLDRRNRVAVLTVILVLGLVLAGVLVEQSVTSKDRVPLLSPTAGTITESFDASANGPWTLGFQLCLAAQGSVRLLAIGPSQSVGSGLQYIGSLARTFAIKVPRNDSGAAIDADMANNPLGGIKGYPPAIPGRLYPAVGYEVSAVCGNDHPGESYTELLIGITRSTHAGGGWLGIRVDYEEHEHRRHAVLAYNLAVCGPSVISSRVVTLDRAESLADRLGSAVTV